MIDKINQLISKYDNWIPFENLELRNFIISGGSCNIYDGKYNSKDVIIKMLDTKYYDYNEQIIEDIKKEIDIYDIIKNKSEQLCFFYGFSFSNIDKNYQLYLILKDYNINGDLKDLIKSNYYWFKYNNKTNINLYEYYYKYRGNEWIYNLDRDYKIHITNSLCNSLKCLHDKDIVHCDLKLNNMIIVDDEIILIDFGVSHCLYNNKIIVVNEDLGTLGYMCEELGFGLCSKKSDIFSLGVCILELWVGEIWKDGNSYKECRKEILNSLKYLEYKEKNLSKIIRKCIKKDPRKRPYIKTIIKNLSIII